MRTTAIINLKGGVGKTVTAINLAAILAARHDKRVLLIDADSQHNTSDFFGVTDEDGGLTAYLAGEQEPFYGDMIEHTSVPGLDLLPGNNALMDMDISAIRDGRADKRCLVDLTEALAEDDAYDHIIVDCPPAFNAASVAALAAVDEVIIPISLDAFSVAGLSNMVRQVFNMRQINPRLRVAGVLITKWHKDVAEHETELRQFSRVLPVYDQTIRDSRKVTSMTYSGDPLIIHSPHSAAATDYRRWVTEYLYGCRGEDKHGKAV